MKKLLLFITLFLFVGLDAAVSQRVTVRFTARNSNGGYQSFDSVIVENLQQGWNQRIAYPDTVLYLGNDYNSINLPSDAMETGLKVYPNPFAGHTETLFDLVESGTVNIRLLRINGTLIAYHSGHYAAGSYRIGISLAEPQVAFLSVEAAGQRCIAKLVNRAGGGSNSIDMKATASHNDLNSKAVGIGSFAVGDQMRYTAISSQGGSRTVSTSVMQYQIYSELITLFFEDASPAFNLPTVTTSSVSSITSSTAICGGNVTNSGGATVTARGVCWSTSHNPTVSNSHTTDGSGTGTFTSSMTGLSQITTYYVRAYATNSVGTAYGEERTFTTNTPSVGGFDQNGASNAVFTVAEGRTVRFSKGNLQYQASTNTWRFAEHQYDCIGADNQNISSTYNGWIDLFGWGTSGWNSGAIAYQPWSTSTYYGDYHPGGEYTSNLTGSYANADWGVYNAISNGGNQAGMWRTLTRDEWNYLLFTRNGSTVSGTVYARFARATVGGVKGLIVFPDSFTLPTGITMVGINSSGSGYSDNTYTTSEWSQLEGNGALFMPAAGYREGSSVSGVGTYASGYYWSSSYYSQSYAMCAYFNSGSMHVSSEIRYYGYSVRLVKD